MPYAASKGGGRCRIALKYRRKRHEALQHRTLAESMIANSRSDNAGIFFVSCCSTRHEHPILFRAHKEGCAHNRMLQTFGG